MTTLDASKLKRILTPVSAYNGTANLEMAQAIWAAAQAEQREADAVHLEVLVYQGELSISEVSAAIHAIRSQK